MKIDRSFVASLTEAAAGGSIVDAMIAMGHSLGLQVTAEGVETAEHLRTLRMLGCDSAQGYLFSRPVSAREIERLAHAHDPIAPPDDDLVARVELDLEALSFKRQRLIDNLLAELQRLTGLESVYLTRIDWNAALQHVTHARNAGTLNIAEGLVVDWGDTICRRALDQGVVYTGDVPSTFADSSAGKDLGLQTYVGVPLYNSTGHIEGTLCGASSVHLPLVPEAVEVMTHFAEMIGGHADGHFVRAASATSPPLRQTT